MIGEAEVSSYNAMSACKSTFEFSGVGVQFDAYDMVWTAWNTEWACQKEPFEVIHLGVEAFLWFGSYVASYGSEVIWEYVVLDISGWWDSTTMIWYGNESVSICLLTWAIVIHSDVTPSYAMMRSDRRGLWWICNEFKPLPAYTTMVVSSWFSFKDFSQVFPMRDYGFYIEWCTIMMIFVRVFS